MQNIMEMLAGPWITATVIIIINFTSAYSCGQNSFASGGRWCWQIKSNTENVSPIISLYPISVSGVFPVGNSEGAHTKMGPVFFYFTSKTKLQIKLRAKQQMKPPDVLIKVKYVLDWGESGGMDEGQKIKSFRAPRVVVHDIQPSLLLKDDQILTCLSGRMQRFSPSSTSSPLL